MPSYCDNRNHRARGEACGMCRTDAIVSGDIDAVRAWHRNAQEIACIERIPQRYRDAEPDHEAVTAWVADWNHDPRTCPSLLLMGNVGTGKTWQAYGALRAAVTGPRAIANDNGQLRAWRNTSWIATTAADMYAALRPAPKRDTETELARYRTTDLLVVDDLGAAKASEWVEEVLYRIVGGRYDAMVPSVFTTNLGPAELKDALGDRIVSRLAETCTRVVLEGQDRRRVKPVTV